MKLYQLPPDKANHLIYGLLIYCVVGLYSPQAGLLAATIAALAKEAYDSTGRGRVEVLDCIATVAGGALGFFCSMVL